MSDDTEQRISFPVKFEPEEDLTALSAALTGKIMAFTQGTTLYLFIVQEIVSNQRTVTVDAVADKEHVVCLDLTSPTWFDQATAFYTATGKPPAPKKAKQETGG